MISNNKKGFTLVELLVTIGIISIILVISTVSVYTIINNSKENSNKLTIDNIKDSADLYVKEYKNEVSWEEKNINEYETCIPIQTLIAKGYLKKEILDNKNIPLSIKLTRDEYNNIISEVAQQYDCGTYAKIVKIPASNDICNNYTYDGSNHFLIKQNFQTTNYKEIKYVDTTYKNTNKISEHPKNAGEYKVSINLADGYQWNDNTTAPKTVTCKINKKTPILELSSNGNSDTDIGTKTILLTSEVNGIISIKSSNKNYVTVEVIDGKKNITASTKKKINITTLAQRNSTTSVTITVTPTGKYANNYEKATITYIVGNIKTVKVDKPTSDICYDLSYNGNSQELARVNEAYKLVNNSGIEIGNYKVTARLNYGYTWKNNTTDNIEFVCEIKTPKPVITYKNATCNPQSVNVTYNKKYGENQNLCIPTKTGYTFEGWYNDKELTQKITNNNTVTNFKNHDLYARWSPNTDTKYEVKHYKMNLDDKNYTLTDTETLKGETDSSIIPNTKNYTGFTAPPKQSLIIKADSSSILKYYYSRNSYKVTFDANGGYISTSSTTVLYEDIYRSLPETSRTGYTFNGWYTEKSGGTKITKNSKFTDTSAQVLYAHWSANEYTVTLDANGGTVTPTSIKVTYDKIYDSLPEATRTGYTFEGWYTGASSGTKVTKDDKVSITKDQTLYAHWKSKSYLATVTTSSYDATASCTEGRTLNNGNCIYKTTCEEPCIKTRCDSGCGKCYVCPYDKNEVCGCEDDGGKWVYYEATCEKDCTLTQNEYRIYTCPKGGTLTETTCKVTTYTCPNGGTLKNDTCIFE